MARLVFRTADNVTATNKSALTTNNNDPGRDLELSESGYIFRSDDRSPPLLIKLGTSDNDKFNNMIKKAGIEMPPNGITYSSSPTEKAYTKENYTPNFSLNHGYEQHEQVELEDEDQKNVHIPSFGAPKKISDDDEDDATLSEESDEKNSEEDEDKSKTDEKVTYSYSTEPIRFEYVSTSADDDGYEILMEKLRNRGEDEIPSQERHFEEIYKPSKSSGKPLYETEKTYEGFDVGSPTIDFKLDTKTGLSKSYIAPIFELPSTYDTSFERHTAPVKYTLKKKPKFIANPAAIHSADLVDEHDGHGSDLHEDHHDGIGSLHHVDHHDGHDDHSFDKGSGGSYHNEHHSNHGDKHNKGFKDFTEFDTKEKSKYGKEEDKGFYNGKDGHKKHHYSEGDKFGEHHNKKKGVKGNKYGSTGFHKKGHNTKGYHNTFHKDEYKKEHKFYDDAKKEGFFDKFGDFHKKHGAHSGGKHGDGFHESSYEEKHSGKDGLYDKGFLNNEHKGHDNKQGHSSSFSNFENFDKDFGLNENKKFGYQNGNYEDGHLIGGHHY